MENFEPYFCTVEDCKSPFGVAKTFTGLLYHLRDHLPLRYNLYVAGDAHKEFDEAGFDEHVRCNNLNIRKDLLPTLKEVSKRRGAVIFDVCPFCRKSEHEVIHDFQKPDTPQAQHEMRKHIKDHMHDISLFLPDRDNVDNAGCTCHDSTASHVQNSMQSPSGESWDRKTACGHQDCDCKDKAKDTFEDANSTTSIDIGFTTPDAHLDEE